MILVLEKIDLKQSLKKDAYNEKMSYFETRLGELQRACRAAGIPVIILFEGWRGSQRSGSGEIQHIIAGFLLKNKAYPRI